MIKIKQYNYDNDFKKDNTLKDNKTLGVFESILEIDSWIYSSDSIGKKSNGELYSIIEREVIGVGSKNRIKKISKRDKDILISLLGALNEK